MKSWVSKRRVIRVISKWRVHLCSFKEWIYVHLLQFPLKLLPQKSSESRNSDFSVSRGKNSDWDVGLVWICTEKFEFLDLAEFGGVAFSVESVIKSESMFISRVSLIRKGRHEFIPSNEWEYECQKIGENMSFRMMSRLSNWFMLCQNADYLLFQNHTWTFSERGGMNSSTIISEKLSVKMMRESSSCIRRNQVML